MAETKSRCQAARCKNLADEYANTVEAPDSESFQHATDVGLFVQGARSSLQVVLTQMIFGSYNVKNELITLGKGIRTNWCRLCWTRIGSISAFDWHAQIQFVLVRSDINPCRGTCPVETI